MIWYKDNHVKLLWWHTVLQGWGLGWVFVHRTQPNTAQRSKVALPSCIPGKGFWLLGHRMSSGAGGWAVPARASRAHLHVKPELWNSTPGKSLFSTAGHSERQGAGVGLLIALQLSRHVTDTLDPPVSPPVLPPPASTLSSPLHFPFWALQASLDSVLTTILIKECGKVLTSGRHWQNKGNMPLTK